MKNKLITIGLVMMLLVGIGFVLINPIQNYLVARLSEDVVLADVPAPTGDTPPEAEEYISFDFDAVQSLSIVDILRAQANVRNLPVIGSMTIPSVDLKLPVLTGVSEPVLAVGAGTMKPDQKLGEGNYALASHYYENSNVLFGPLYNVKEGDLVYLSDLEYVYEYAISKIDIIKATDVHVIEDVADQTLLTLITCAESGTQRLLVQATFSQRPPLKR